MKISKYLDKIGKDKFKKAYESNERLPSFKVKFKLTRRCNLRCKKCNYWRIQHPDELSLELIKKTIDEISELSCESIKFSGGEVLLRDDLPEIIKYTKSKDMNVSITSNGTLIDEKAAKKLVESGIDQVTISVDSFNETEHDDMVGVKGAWKRSTGAFSLLLKESARLNKKIELVLQCVVSKENYKKLPGMIELANKLSVNKVSFIPYNEGHLEDKSSSPSEEEIKEFNEIIFPEIKKISDKYNISIINPAYFAFKGFNGEHYKKKPCYIPWINYYIAPNGEVYACCSSKAEGFKIGSIKQNNLKDIIHSKEFKEFRQKCKPPILNPVCLKCLNEMNTNKIIGGWLEDGS
jgi:radical SAM protein with 4Fe4S-binding SPASM domain